MSQTSKLLLDEPPLVVIPSLAKVLGLNEAIFVQQLHYWLQLSKHEHDGMKWRYASCEEWTQELPWLSTNGIRKLVKRLENQGIIITANYNKMKIDRTKWYSIRYDHVVLRGARSGAKCATIPETTTEITTKQYNTVNSADAESLLTYDGKRKNKPAAPLTAGALCPPRQEFDKARRLYPGTKLGLDAEYEHFRKKYKDTAAILPLLLPAIEREIEHKAALQKAGQFCPQWANFRTWINQRRWEQEFPTIDNDDIDYGPCGPGEFETHAATEEELKQKGLWPKGFDS